jgi:hypothetical protein
MRGEEEGRKEQMEEGTVTLSLSWRFPGDAADAEQTKSER